MQRQMLTIIAGVRPLVHESVEDFCRRRARIARRLQLAMGCWGEKWAIAIGLWKVHLERDRNQSTWAAMLLSLRSPAELALRRTVNFGRPAVRSTVGYIQRRWAESCFIARDWLAERV